MKDANHGNGVGVGNPAQTLPSSLPTCLEGILCSRAFLPLTAWRWGKLRPAPALSHQPHGSCLVCPHCARTDLPDIRRLYLEKAPGVSRTVVHAEIKGKNKTSNKDAPAHAKNIAATTSSTRQVLQSI